jgi:hypothetical protein
MRTQIEILRGLVEEEEKFPHGKLPDEPHKYFHAHPDAKLIPLHKLRTTRARPEGIKNAEKYMHQAYHGHIDKRAPINLKAHPDGTYSVLDGNSTTAVAKKHGWSHLPGLVQEK